MKISQHTLDKNKTKLNISECLSDFYDMIIHFDNDIEGNNKIKNFRTIARDIESKLEELINKYLNIKDYELYAYRVIASQGNIFDGFYKEKYNNQHIEIDIHKFITYTTPNTSIHCKNKKYLSIEDVEPIFKEIYDYILKNYND